MPARTGVGAKVVDRLSVDLRAELPEMGGLSRSNLLSMRSFAEAWPDEAIVQQFVGQIPWGQNVLLLARVKDPTARDWYARKTIEHGWSRAVLSVQIETKALARLMKRVDAGGMGMRGKCGVCGTPHSPIRRAGWRQPPDSSDRRDRPGADAARLACRCVGGWLTMPDGSRA